MYAGICATAGLIAAAGMFPQSEMPGFITSWPIEKVQNNPSAFPFPSESTRKNEATPADVRPFVHPEVEQSAARWQVQGGSDGTRVYQAFDAEGRLVSLIRLNAGPALREQFIVDYARNVRVNRYMPAGEAALLGMRVAGELPQGYLTRTTDYSYGSFGGRMVLSRVASSARGNQIDFLQITRDGSGRILFGDGRIGASKLSFRNQPTVAEDVLNRSFDLWDQFGRM